MGFGDNEPPALRADAFPASLRGPGGFRILILTFVPWDVIKFTASAAGEPERRLEIDSGRTATDIVLSPTRSEATYTLTAQGCAKAIDGSTGFCSPVSPPMRVAAASNTRSLRQFLRASDVDLSHEVGLRAQVNGASISLRTLMGL